MERSAQWRRPPALLPKEHPCWELVVGPIKKAGAFNVMEMILTGRRLAPSSAMAQLVVWRLAADATGGDLGWDKALNVAMKAESRRRNLLQIQEKP
jgi:hypothetical protein